MAVARLQHFGDNVQSNKVDQVGNEFIVRVGVDGRFTYVDPRSVQERESLSIVTVECTCTCMNWNISVTTHVGDNTHG